MSEREKEHGLMPGDAAREEEDAATDDDVFDQQFRENARARQGREQDQPDQDVIPPKATSQISQYLVRKHLMDGLN